MENLTYWTSLVVFQYTDLQYVLWWVTWLQFKPSSGVSKEDHLFWSWQVTQILLNTSHSLLQFPCCFICNSPGLLLDPSWEQDSIPVLGIPTVVMVSGCNNTCISITKQYFQLCSARTFTQIPYIQKHYCEDNIYIQFTEKTKPLIQSHITNT